MVYEGKNRNDFFSVSEKKKENIRRRMKRLIKFHKVYDEKDGI